MYLLLEMVISYSYASFTRGVNFWNPSKIDHLDWSVAPKKNNSAKYFISNARVGTNIVHRGILTINDRVSYRGIPPNMALNEVKDLW